MLFSTENNDLNILTVDLEEWFHANYNNITFFDDNKEGRVIRNTEVLLDLFDKHDVKATFFVLGWVAERYSGLIKKVYDCGHEIATHGYGHQLIGKLEKMELISDIKKSKEILEDIIGEKVIGYRAPSWSINKENLWVLDVLKQMDFKYDASIFPVKNFLYGIPDAPRFPYKLNNGLLEIPCSTIRVLRKNFGFSGGFYLRLLPLELVKYGINKLNKHGAPAIVYIHPREIDINQPRLILNKLNYFIHYYGIGGCYNKLYKLLGSYKFTSIKKYCNFV